MALTSMATARAHPAGKGHGDRKGRHYYTTWGREARV